MMLRMEEIPRPFDRLETCSLLGMEMIHALFAKSAGMKEIKAVPAEGLEFFERHVVIPSNPLGIQPSIETI